MIDKEIEDILNDTIENQIEQAYLNKDLDTLKDMALTFSSLEKEAHEYHSLAMISLAKMMGKDISDEPRLKHVSGFLQDLLDKLKKLENKLSLREK